jgi:hypothetical protein
MVNDRWLQWSKGRVLVCHSAAPGSIPICDDFFIPSFYQVKAQIIPKCWMFIHGFFYLFTLNL